MKIIDFLISKIAKIPLSSKRSSFSFLSSSGSTASVSNYYTSWVYLSVSIIAQEVAGIILKLYKEDSKGNVEQIFKHPSLDLIYKANDFMTQYDLFERLQSNQELRGNEYWYLQMAGKVPMGIYPLIPEFVSPVPDPYEYVKAYTYQIDGAKIEIPKENILHFKQFNPSSDIVGLSTLEAARLAADTDNYARQYNKKYFQNSARPDVILEYPETLDPDDEKRLLASWNQSHSGANSQFKTAVASGGLKISSFQISQKDMEFLQGRQFNRDEIMAIFRVPLAIAGFTGNETYASAKAAAYAFGARTIMPKMRRIINILNEFYLPMFTGTEGMYFEFESPVLEDREQTLREYESGLNKGWFTLNDVRRKENLPEIQGGDTAYIPFNITPLGDPLEGKTFSEPIMKFSKMFAEAAMKSIPEEKPEVSEEEKRFEVKGKWTVKERDTRGLEYEKQFNKALNHLWGNQKQSAINNLNASLSQKEWRTKAVDLIDKEKEVKETIDLFSPLMLALVSEEGKAAMEYLGTGEFTITPRIRKFLETNTKKFAGGVTDETSAKIRSTIAAGLEAKESIQDLEKRIMNSTAFNLPRAEKIARTETLRAQGKATIEVWKDSEVVSGKIWYTAEDERVCENCGPMHGKEIGLDDYFFKMGDTAPGGLELNYEHIDIAELHPQCRCVLIPVVKS